MVQEPENKEID